MYHYQRLLYLREQAKKSQKEIAEYLGVSQQHYSLYEQGKRELPMHLFIQLAKLYHTSLDYMAGLSNTKDGGKQGLVSHARPSYIIARREASLPLFRSQAQSYFAYFWRGGLGVHQIYLCKNGSFEQPFRFPKLQDLARLACGLPFLFRQERKQRSRLRGRYAQ